MKINLTDLEKQMLENIATSEWTEVNGAEPENADETNGFYFTEYLDRGMQTNQVKGVVSSLVKKGLVCTMEWDDEPTQIWLTDEGFNSYKSLKD